MWKAYQSFRKNEIFNLIIILLRLLIGCTFIYAGIGKIVYIDTILQYSNFEGNQVNKLLKAMAIHRYFWLFIGFVQLLGGVLVATQRLAFLGSLILLIISLNIVVITLPYDFAFTPVIAILLFLATFFILSWDFERIKIFFQHENAIINHIPTNYPTYHSFWIKIGILMSIQSIIFGIFNKTGYWLIISIFIGLTSLITYKSIICKKTTS
jgi:uncharacterized membrane protein YphA (DoxX/SURF4 family)